MPKLKPGYGYQRINGEWEVVVLPEWALAAERFGRATIDGSSCDVFEVINPPTGSRLVWFAQTMVTTRSTEPKEAP